MSNLFLTEQYKRDASGLISVKPDVIGEVCWESPSNIALVKYWGKHGDQLPQNPSLSFTLENSKTKTKIVYQKAKKTKLDVMYFFENWRNTVFENRIKAYLEKISVYQPFVKELSLKIYSDNTFPHSAGIASSASSFSALALGLCSVEQDLFQTLNKEKDFYRKASFLSRLGSGSACRSVYGKTVLWGKTGLVKNSSDEIAVPLDDQVNHVFKSYYDAILVISSEQKTVSSSAGHTLMNDHPFAHSRYVQANENLEKMLKALQNGDEKIFAHFVENEAFSLHSLILSSNQPVILIKPNTLSVIEKLIEFRNKNNLNLTFTLDAGPNIHILYSEKIRKQVTNFIKKELIRFCEDQKWIDDKITRLNKPKRIYENEV